MNDEKKRIDLNLLADELTLLSEVLKIKESNHTKAAKEFETVLTEYRRVRAMLLDSVNAVTNGWNL